MTTPSKLRIALAISAAAPVMMAASLAAAASAPADETSVGEVVVTAEKRTETLREVPQSVSVVSGQTMQRQQAFGILDLVAQVPDLSIAQDTPGQARVVLRGVNTNGVASTVAIYLDETPFGSSTGLADGAVLAADFDTFDVARLEVLRGPQGTLYGASSLGGVLRYVSNAPELGRVVVRGQASVAGVQGGDVDWTGDAVVNAPLGDTAAVRVSGFYRRDGGYEDEVGTAGSLVRDNVNWDDVYGGRASVLFKPTDTLSIRLSADLQDTKVGAQSQVDADPVTGKPLYGDLTHSAFYPEHSRIDYRVYNATVNWDLGFASLLSTTSYGTLTEREVYDATSLQIAPPITMGEIATAYFADPGQTLGVYEGQNLDQKKWTQEVRLASPTGQRIEWLLGGYYTHETASLGQILTAFDTSSLVAPASIPALETVNLHSTYEEFAGFGDLTLHLTRQFSIAAGGRYSHNKQEGVEAIDGALVGGPEDFVPGNSSEGVFTYSVAPKLELGEHAAVYARIAKGYRPGGPNILPPGAPTDTPTSYKADSIISYEAGVKADFLDRRLSVDASAFYLDWTDVQLLADINGFGVNTNGGTAVSKGVEFSVTARPVVGLQLQASGDVLSAKLTEDTPAITGGLKGDRLPFAPKWSLTLGGDYEHAIGRGYSGFAGATLALVGPQYPGFDPAYAGVFGGRFEMKSYARLDLRAGVRRDNWTLEVFAKNVNNSQGLANVEAYQVRPNGALGVTPIRPRTVGVSLSADF